jgi:NAD(P)-dependent dehydrogenase (short-subunit alcohol dehydrogenase family)
VARMYPPEISAEVASAAERQLFAMLKDGLAMSWTVLHSLGVIGHREKPWAEIDFVLIGPGGVYCLEVKGGRVRRSEGVWTFTDRFNRVTTKREGPFEQVGACAAIVHKMLNARLPWMRQSIVGYGVATPDVRFEQLGVDVDRDLVYDADDSQRPIGQYVLRLTDHWRRHVEERREKPPIDLSANQVAQCSQTLRPDFDLRPSLSHHIDRVNRELIKLTLEQFNVLDGLQENLRVLVRGGAGTGKTVLAVEEARRAAAEGARVLYCCFNRHLADHVRVGLEGLNSIAVQSIHGYMASLIDAAGLRHRIPDVAISDIYEVSFPDLAMEALVNSAGPQFDVLIMDESQDLLHKGYLDVLDLALAGGLDNGRWRAFLDPHQNIFDGSHSGQMARLVSTHAASFKLSVNCRNTAPIATSTAILSGIKSDEVLSADGPAVEYHWFRNGPEERRLVSRSLGRLLSEGVKPAQIVILSSRRLESSCLASGFERLPYELTQADPGSGSIRFATIQSFKGLEADSVFLVDIDELSSDKGRGIAYVGASRARATLSVFASEPARSDFIAHAEQLGESLAGDRLLRGS